MTLRTALLIVGYAAVASVSGWGWPWNMPAVLFGGFAVGFAATRRVSQ